MSWYYVITLFFNTSISVLLGNRHASVKEKENAIYHNDGIVDFPRTQDLYVYGVLIINGQI